MISSDLITTIQIVLRLQVTMAFNTLLVVLVMLAGIWVRPAATGGHSQLLGPARILLLPFPGLNHSADSSMAHLGEELAGRGHEVHLLVSSDYSEQQQLMHQGITPITYNGGNSQHSSRGGGSRHRGSTYDRDRDTGGNSYGRDVVFQPYDEFTRNQVKHWRHVACSEPLSDHDLFQRLRRMNFDLAVVNSHPVSRCLLVLPYRLGIPYVSMVEHVEPWLQGNPQLPSVMPFVYGPSDYSDQMTFWERFNNLWALASWSYDPQIETHREDYLARFTPDKSPRHADDLAKDSVLWFIESDVVLEYPRSNMPNVIDIGGITLQTGKKLPADMQAFMEDAKSDSVIIVDLGKESNMDDGFSSSNMPYDVEERLAAAFKQTRYHYIWRYYGDRPPMKYSENSRVKMVSWLPRNDVLAHTNTRLFITDGSTNSQYEALYHGVPSLVVSSHGGQAYAARRVAHRGYGLHLDAHSFSSGEAVDTIEELLHNSSYTHNIQRAAAVFRSRDKNARERAGDWLEHVLSHNMDYIQSHGQRLSQSALSMLDVVSFLVVGHLVAAYGTYKMLSIACRRLCCGKRRFRDDDDDEYTPGSSSGSPSNRHSQYRSGGRGRKH